MRRILIPFGIIAILIVGGTLVLSFYAVKFIQAQVQKAIGPGFTIAQIKVKATHLSINGIRFEDPGTKQKFLRIEETRIYPDLLSFLKRRLQIRELVILSPSFFFHRTREGVFIGPWVSIKKEEKSGEAPGKEEKKEGETISIKINRLRIEKGAIDFDDMKAGETPGQIRWREVDLEIKNIEYPIVSSRSPIELKGMMKGKTKEGEIVSKGWIDLKTSDMETSLIVSKGWIDLKTSDMETSLKIREVELKVFEPYYRKRVSAEIEFGHLNMDAHIAIKKSVIDVPGKLELADLRVKEEGTIFYIPAKTLLSRLKDKGNRVEVQFHVKGNLDDPRFKLQETFLMRIGIGLAEALGLPIKAVGAGGLEEGVGLLEELFKKKEKRR
ncbi:MAG: DUF748 domain-containing protein [Deltaproteobacteria bacterium]|nr:DUF748 domain-containing protein [Deltaproteobacteria bacterium]